MALSIDFLCDVGAVHSGTDDNCVEGEAPVVDGFVVGIADIAAQYVDGKSGFLYLDCVRSFLEIANHVVLLRAG